MNAEEIFIYFLIGVVLVGIIACSIVYFVCKKHIRDIEDRTKYKPYLDNVWSWLIADVDKFVYKGWCEFKKDKIAHEWIYGHYIIMVWVDADNKKHIPDASVHTQGYYFDGEKIDEAGDCVISSFNQYRSRHLASILLRGLWAKNMKIYGDR